MIPEYAPPSSEDLASMDSLKQEWLDSNKTIRIEETSDAIIYGWHEVSEPKWEHAKAYRKFPFPDYKPFTSEYAEILIGSKVINNESGDYFLIVNVARDRVRFYCTHVKYPDLLKHYHFNNGTPCGIRITPTLLPPADKEAGIY